MDPSEKQTLRSIELAATVRRILREEWDPIGVRAIAGAQGEYDGYAPPICRLIDRRAAPTEIFDYLWAVETERMGLPGDREKTARAAEMLHALGK